MHNGELIGFISPSDSGGVPYTFSRSHLCQTTPTKLWFGSKVAQASFFVFCFFWVPVAVAERMMTAFFQLGR